MCTCMSDYVFIGDQTSSVFFNCSAPSLLRQGLSLNLEFADLPTSAAQQAPEIFLSPPSHG